MAISSKKVKNQKIQLKSMASSVGDFIRYWGFRRIHGQLWTQIYLSQNALSGAELVKALGVSKALVSPALGELINYRLIECTEVDGRTKKYAANPKVFEVIQKILKDRERSLIAKAKENFELLSSLTRENDPLINNERLRALGEMISAGSFALDLVISSADQDNITNWFSDEALLKRIT